MYIDIILWLCEVCVVLKGCRKVATCGAILAQEPETVQVRALLFSPMHRGEKNSKKTDPHGLSTLPPRRTGGGFGRPALPPPREGERNPEVELQPTLGATSGVFAGGAWAARYEIAALLESRCDPLSLAEAIRRGDEGDHPLTLWRRWSQSKKPSSRHWRRIVKVSHPGC